MLSANFSGTIPVDLLHLQRVSGNAAVARLVAQSQAHVQRCGAVPCNCSAEERALVQRNGPPADAKPASKPGRLDLAKGEAPFTADVSVQQAVLTYHGKQKVVLSASSDAQQLMKGDLAGRPPFAFEYVPVPEEQLYEATGVAPRVFPIIRVVAAPGVDIQYENWPDYPFFDLQHPMVQIYRVQNPADLPTPGSPINPNSVSGGIPTDPAREKGKSALALGLARVLTVPRDDGVDFAWYDPNPDHSGHGGETFSVTAPPQSGTARFAYEVVPPEAGKLQTWTIKLVKTPSVKIKTAGAREGGWSMIQEDVYEVDSVADVPNQGDQIKPVGRQVRSWEAETFRDPNWAALVFDTAISFIPIVGDLYMLAEFAYGTATGHDFFGQRLTKTDLAILGAAAMLPYAGGGLRLAKGLAKAAIGLRDAEKLVRAAELMTEAERAEIKAQEAIVRGGKQVTEAERGAMIDTVKALDASAEKGAAEAAQDATKATPAVEIATKDGAHELKVSEKGIIRCSDRCEILQKAYIEQLKADQSLKTRLKNVRATLKAKPNDAAALEALKDIESKLRAERAADEAAIIKAGSGQAGTVTRNALSEAEFNFASELAKRTNKHFVGPPRDNFPGLDGWLDGVPVQLKEASGGLQAVLTRVSQAETKAIEADRTGVELYVKAPNVKTMDMLDFAFKGPMKTIRDNKVLSKISVQTADGSVVL